MRIVEAPSGLRGFDCNQPLTAGQAKAFRDDGRRFVCRYVPRVAPHPGDLSLAETEVILPYLGLMVVQHVQKPGWAPTPLMGAQYGAYAAMSSHNSGILLGTSVWCDLEGVARGVDPADVIGFLNNWSDNVGRAGYTPGLYVGYDPGLSAEQLYGSLHFEHYWSAYNLNRDQVPAKRGVQMKQDFEKVLMGVRYDPDVITADNFGGLPLLHVDEEWSPT